MVCQTAAVTATGGLPDSSSDCQWSHPLRCTVCTCSHLSSDTVVERCESTSIPALFASPAANRTAVCITSCEPAFIPPLFASPAANRPRFHRCSHHQLFASPRRAQLRLCGPARVGPLRAQRRLELHRSLLAPPRCAAACPEALRSLSSLPTACPCVQRGLEIGVDMDEAMAAAAAAPADLAARLAAATDPAVVLPSYYAQPFHAYPDGNLCWDAALEAEAAAQSVHATVMDPANVAVQPDGDSRMRASYHATARKLLEGAGRAAALDGARSVVDLGCAVGLSSVAAAAAHPGADVLGALSLSALFGALSLGALSLSVRSLSVCSFSVRSLSLSVRSLSLGALGALRRTLARCAHDCNSAKHVVRCHR